MAGLECPRCTRCFRDRWSLTRHQSRKTPCIPSQSSGTSVQNQVTTHITQNNTILVLGDRERTLIEHRNIVKLLMDIHDTVPGDSLYVVMDDVLLTFGEYVSFLNYSLQAIRSR